MAYHFRRKDASVQESLRHVAISQIDAALEETDDPTMEVHEKVHQVRKRCKKVRGLIRLVRPEFDDYKHENKVFRDAARTLSVVRDAETLVETYDALMDAYADRVERVRFANVRRQLTLRKKEAATDSSLNDKLVNFRESMSEARKRAKKWPLDADGFEAVAGGLAKTYERARKAMLKAEDKPAEQNVHEWRKRSKYHWYHARLLREIWPELIGPHRDETHRLSDLLGEHHDLAVLRSTVAAEPEAFGEAGMVRTLTQLAEQRQAELAADGFTLGHRIFAESPKALCKRWEAYWREWQTERRLPEFVIV
ncbi:MAG TPA: CHAD domain-containing protein [Alphaproteobacteria bacterium]|nr:CHAD domain-containing protein [Alphaproteobacteria bacterium]